MVIFMKFFSAVISVSSDLLIFYQLFNSKQTIMTTLVTKTTFYHLHAHFSDHTLFWTQLK